VIEYLAIRPGPARQLAAGLRQAGEEAAASRDRIAAILAEGGESAPLMERQLTDVASWAQELAGDIEWRVEAMVALDGASPSSPGLLSGVLPSTEAEAARVVLRAELERRYTETRQEIETALAQTTAAIGAGSGDMEAGGCGGERGGGWSAVGG
jgi:hypothetical protein